jgi:hypothetical protein
MEWRYSEIVLTAYIIVFCVPWESLGVSPGSGSRAHHYHSTPVDQKKQEKIISKQTSELHIHTGLKDKSKLFR